MKISQHLLIDQSPY